MSLLVVYTIHTKYVDIKFEVTLFSFANEVLKYNFKKQLLTL